jgi:hypothetical protein
VVKGLKAREGAPTGKDRKTLLRGTNAYTVRKRDIGKMNAFIRGRKGKEKVTVAAIESLQPRDKCSLGK